MRTVNCNGVDYMLIQANIFKGCEYLICIERATAFKQESNLFTVIAKTFKWEDTAILSQFVHITNALHFVYKQLETDKNNDNT